MTGCDGVTVAWSPPMDRSSEPILVGVCAHTSVPKRRAVRLRAHLEMIEAGLALNQVSFYL